MSNKKKKTRTKARPVMGFQGSGIGYDEKGRAYRVLSPGGLQPGAVAVKVKKGLQGDYRDTCLACLRPTDTALGIIGPAEATVAFHMALGMPWEESLTAAQAFWQDQGIWDGDPGHVPPGDELTSAYRLCAACCAEHVPGMRVGLLPGEVPFYRFPPPPAS